MIDVTQQINSVRRRVGSTVLEVGEARIVTISQTYDTDIDDVWDACTNPERIPRWFMAVSGDLRVGGRYQLEKNAAERSSAVIRRTASPRRGSTARVSARSSSG